MPNPKFQFQMQSNKDADIQIELLNNVSSVMESILIQRKLFHRSNAGRIKIRA